MLLEDGGQQDTLLVRVRTGETRRLTDDPLREDFLEWAPDRSQLYFTVAPEEQNELRSIRPDGSEREREVAPENGRDITGALASPDGRWVAGYSYSLTEGRRPPLTLFDTQKKTFEELVDLKATPWCGWLPDSRRLLLATGGKLEVLDRVTRTFTPAGSLGGDVRTVVISRDGRSLFASKMVVEADIWMLDYGPAP